MTCLSPAMFSRTILDRFALLGIRKAPTVVDGKGNEVVSDWPSVQWAARSVLGDAMENEIG